MEGSESEAIFDSLNLHPHGFINEALNLVDDLVDGAFDFYQQQASTLLGTEGTDRSDDLRKGIESIRDIVQASLDKRLGGWENYCLRHCFTIPEGISLPKQNQTGENLMDDDAHNDPELDEQLDYLSTKLTLVEKETDVLNRELRELEKQCVVSRCCAEFVQETLHLYDQNHDVFQEILKATSEFHEMVENFKSGSRKDIERIRTERIYDQTNDFDVMNHIKGLSNTKLEKLQQFVADIENTEN